MAVTASPWSSRRANGQAGTLDATLHVDDLHAADTAAAAGLWRFLLGVDLIAHVEAAVPLDDPLDLLLADQRHAVVTGVADETWLRLVDVPAALAARTFATGAAGHVLLAVHDPLLPDNAGVYRIAGEGAERVGPAGRVRAGALVRRRRAGDGLPGRPQPVDAGRHRLVDRARPGGAAPGGRAVRHGTVPWCGTHF